MELSEARERILETDREMAALFLKRMETVREIAAIKKEEGLPLEDKEREARLMEELVPLIKDEELRPLYVRFLENNIKLSKEFQRIMIDKGRTAG